MSSKFRSKWQKIKERDWSIISERWVKYIPEIKPNGSKPDPGVDQYPPLLSAIDSIAEFELQEDIPGLREHILWESIYMSHKALHIMRGAQRHASSGMISWSLFSAYHSAYLSAKAVIGFLGVTLPKLEGLQVLIDIFPGVKKPKKRKVALHVTDNENFILVKLGQLDQRCLWELLQRVLNITTFHRAKLNFYRESILNLDWSEISRRRNPFIYSPTFWPYDDLFYDLAVGEIFSPLIDSENEWVLSETNQAFLMELSFVLFDFCRELFFDLSQKAPVLGYEYNYILNLCDEENSPLYHGYTNELAI